MRTYTEEQLKELGILFYEDIIPKIASYIQSNTFYNKREEEITEDDFYSREYQDYIDAYNFLKETKGKTGPMNIDNIFFAQHIL